MQDDRCFGCPLRNGGVYPYRVCENPGDLVNAPRLPACREAMHRYIRVAIAHQHHGRYESVY